MEASTNHSCVICSESNYWYNFFFTYMYNMIWELYSPCLSFDCGVNIWEISDRSEGETSSNVQTFKEISSKNISITLKLLTHFKTLQEEEKLLWENILEKAVLWVLYPPLLRGGCAYLLTFLERNASTWPLTEGLWFFWKRRMSWLGAWFLS